MTKPKNNKDANESVDSSVQSDIRLIKKYPNRRVYDTSTSQYIKVDDIRQMVIDGVDFKVIDTQSKDDITRSILLQIIFDQESEMNPLFSADNLKNFIRYSELKTDVFSPFLNQSLQYFNQQQQEMNKYLSGDFSAEALNPFSKENVNRWQTMQKQFFDSFSTGGSDKEK